MAGHADEHLAIPVTFREDKHFFRNISKLRFDFEEERRNYAPACYIKGDLIERNVRSDIIKLLRGYHIEHHGELETLAIVVNMLDRLLPKRLEHASSITMTLMSCYSIASNLHDVVPMNVCDFSAFLHQPELSTINLAHSLVILSDLQYNTRGFTPIDFFRTFVNYLADFENRYEALTGVGALPPPPSSSHSPCISSVPTPTTTSVTTQAACPFKKESSTCPLPLTVRNEMPLFDSNVTLFRKIAYYRDSIVLKATLNYNLSLHSTKLANYYASEIAAACIVRACNCIKELERLVPLEMFVHRIPLLNKYHSVSTWLENATAALHIVSKYSCADYRTG